MISIYIYMDYICIILLLWCILHAQFRQWLALIASAIDAGVTMSRCLNLLQHKNTPKSFLGLEYSQQLGHRTYSATECWRMERIEAAAGIKRQVRILPLGVFDARKRTTRNNKIDGQQHFLKREVKVYSSLIIVWYSLHYMHHHSSRHIILQAFKGHSRSFKCNRFKCQDSRPRSRDSGRPRLGWNECGRNGANGYEISWNDHWISD